MKNATESKNEIIQLTQEALKLASTACHFDRNQNYIGACDYYDKCLLNMDEVLNKLSPNSEEWKQLLTIRQKYDDRMEFLRENESNKFNLTSLTVGTNKSDGGKAPTGKRTPRKRAHFSDETYVTDAVSQQKSLEEAPDNLSEIPYWQLRNIQRTILDGGFLTESIFIPKKIWTQVGAKFSGLAAKTAAFDIVIKLITTHLDVLYLSDDEDSLGLAADAFLLIEDELASLQNQLSKPFPYIKESSLYSSSTLGTSSHGSSHGMDDVSSYSGSPSQSTTNSGMGGNSNKPPTGSTPTTNRTFGSMVSALGKNMKKYAELSYQRLVVALPSRMTSEDMAEYTALILKLCEKCQILDSWFRFVLQLKLDVQAADMDSNESCEQTPPSSMRVEPPSSPDKLKSSNIPIRTHRNSLDNETLLIKVNAMLSSLQNISLNVKGVVCEILLRDIENLTERYLTKTRKSFSRMYWDDDVEYAE